MEERYKMYLEKARNVSDVPYRAQVFVTQVLIMPVPPDCTVLLVAVSCLLPTTLPCWSGSWCVSTPLLVFSPSYSSASDKTNTWLIGTLQTWTVVTSLEKMTLI